jgi:hypothetical protein
VLQVPTTATSAREPSSSESLGTPGWQPRLRDIWATRSIDPSTGTGVTSVPRAWQGRSLRRGASRFSPGRAGVGACSAPPRDHDLDLGTQERLGCGISVIASAGASRSRQPNSKPFRFAVPFQAAGPLEGMIWVQPPIHSINGAAAECKAAPRHPERTVPPVSTVCVRLKREGAGHRIRETSCSSVLLGGGVGGCPSSSKI